MGLFNLFGNKPKEDIPAQNGQEVHMEETDAPERKMKESDFVDMSDPNGDNFSVRLIDCGTGYAIDAIYSYIGKDYEEQGKADAAINSDISCMEKKVELIEQGLMRLFDMVILKYDDEIRKIETKKKTLQELGLLSSIDNCDAVIATCNQHIKKIGDLKKAFAEKDPSLMFMIDSYKRGFAIGVANKTQEQIDKVSR